MKNKVNFAHIIPVLISFFVMSFIDLVGTGVDEIKKDASVPSYVLQLIPFAAFIWFFVLSVPVGIWQDKIGKKNALIVGILITAIGLFVPAFGNSFPVILTAFSLLGIGNTILQVSANPLLVDVVPSEKAPSFLSFSQFVKAIGSMVGPFVAAFIAPVLAEIFQFQGEAQWRFGLYLFAVISVLTALWLGSVKIDETKSDREKASFSSCMNLLSNRFVALMVLGIFFVVGIDVAMNSNIATFLENKLSISGETSRFAKSIYFFAKMLGAFSGAILLTKFSARSFLIISSWVSLAAILSLSFIPNEFSAWVIIFVIGFGLSNIFPLIFSIAVDKLPKYSNEISGLMMMAICGGAFIPFLVGIAMEQILIGGIIALALCAAYLLLLGYSVEKK